MFRFESLTEQHPDCDPDPERTDDAGVGQVEVSTGIFIRLPGQGWQPFRVDDEFLAIMKEALDRSGS